jgi:hypothetical protein
MVFKKEIIYPIFLDCCLHIENNTWRQIFEDLAYGICPYKSFINKGYLCCNVKNKSFIYKINNKKDPNDIYEDVKKIFEEKLDILGTNYKENETFEQNPNEHIFNKWSKIKKKNIREFLMHNFLVEIKKKYNIKKSDIINLKKTIIVGMMFKTISADDIIIENGKIVNINNIRFDKEKIIFEKDFIEFDLSSLQKEVQEKKSLYDIYMYNK